MENDYELSNEQKWQKENNAIYFSVQSDGTTGPKWIDRLREQGKGVTENAKALLMSRKFKATKNIKKDLVILFFDDIDCKNSNIYEYRYIYANKSRHKLERADAETACLIRELFSDKEIKKMGFSLIIVPHDKIRDKTNERVTFQISSSGFGNWLDVHRTDSNNGYYNSFGFVFVLAKTKIS